MVSYRHVRGTSHGTSGPNRQNVLWSGELRKHGVRLKLQDQPFQLLALLLEHAGDVVTREELRQRLWPADTFVDFDTGLNSAVKKLRDVLADSADQPHYIETIPRRGYRFIAPLVDPNPPSVPSPAPEPGAPRTRNHLLSPDRFSCNGSRVFLFHSLEVAIRCSGAPPALGRRRPAVPQYRHRRRKAASDHVPRCVASQEPLWRPNTRIPCRRE